MVDERLHTFLAVARSGSLSAAARLRHVTQPAVTQQIRRLEAEHQTQLLVRHDRGVTLTPAGEVLLDYAVRLVDLGEQATEALAELHQVLAGSLLLGASFTTGEHVLPRLIAGFKSLHPKLDIVLEIHNTPRVVEQVAAGAFAVGVIEAPFQNPLVRAEKLVDDELYVVCGRTHRLAGRAQLTLDGLSREVWVLREPGSGTRQVFEAALSAAGGDPTALRVPMQLGSTEAIKGLVIEGLGLTVMSPWSVQQELTDERLWRLEVPALDLHRSFRFVSARGRVPALVREFCRFCREQLRAGPVHGA